MSTLRYIIPLLFLIITSCNFPGVPIPPKADKGILDLRNWDFKKNGTVSLEGEWEFYWKKTIDPKRYFPDSEKTESLFITVPNSWASVKIKDKEIGHKGYGSYRLQILLPEEIKEIGFNIPNVGSAYKLYINGHFLASAGHFGKDSEKTEEAWIPRILHYHTTSDILNFTIHISNFSNRSGGLYEAITIGPYGIIYRNKSKSIAGEIFLIGCAFIIGFYHLLLFLMRRQERVALYFGLFCIIIAIRSIVMGNRFINSIFPGFNWELLAKIEYLTFYLGVPVFLLFLKNLFLKEFNNIITRSCIAIGILFSIFVIFTHPGVFTMSLPIYQIFTITICVYTVILMALAIKRKREGSKIFLSGTIVLLIAVVNDILYANHMIQTGYIISIGMLGFIFSQAFLLSSRYVRAFSKIELLSTELKKKSQTLEELNVSLELKVEERTNDLDVSMNILEMMNKELVTTNQDLVLAHKELKDRSLVLEQTMKAYKESEARYRNILDSIEEGYYEADLNGYFIFLNDSVEKMMQYSKEELLGQHYSSHMNEEYTEKIAKIFTTTYKTKRPSIVFDYKSKRKDGTEFFCEGSTSCIIDSNGIITGFRGILRDITDKKNAEESLKESEKQLQKILKEIRLDLSLAKSIQENLLPKDIDKIGSLSFHIEYHPLIEIGGDIYDIYETAEGKIRIFLADATGHGIVAALMTMIIKSEYEWQKIRAITPLEILEDLNNVFYNTYHSLNIFFTCIVIDIDEQNNRISYASAGHPKQILIQGKDIIALPKTGRAVGLTNEFNCSNKELHFNGSDRLLLYTDGLIEEFNLPMEEFGEERLKEIIRKNINKELKIIITEIMNQVTTFVSENQFNDDITIIGIG